MLTFKEKNIKEQILKTLRVIPTEQFDVKVAIRERVDYLKRFLKNTKKT